MIILPPWLGIPDVPLLPRGRVSKHGKARMLRQMAKREKRRKRK